VSNAAGKTFVVLLANTTERYVTTAVFADGGVASTMPWKPRAAPSVAPLSSLRDRVTIGVETEELYVRTRTLFAAAARNA